MQETKGKVAVIEKELEHFHSDIELIRKNIEKINQDINLLNKTLSNILETIAGNKGFFRGIMFAVTMLSGAVGAALVEIIHKVFNHN